MSRSAVGVARTFLARSEEQDAPPQSFRELYMGNMTQWFGDELQALRHANFDATDLQMLIQALESGTEVFSATEKELLMKRTRDEEMK